VGTVLAMLGMVLGLAIGVFRVAWAFWSAGISLL
jgi:hypothetical protein